MRRFLGGLLILALSLAIVIAVVIVLQSRDEGDVGSDKGPGEKAGLGRSSQLQRASLGATAFPPM